MKTALSTILLLASVTFAEPPKLTLPKEVTGVKGEWIPIKGETDAKNIRFVPIDSGLNVFPFEVIFPELFKTQKATLVQANEEKQYRLLAYTGNGDGGSDPQIVIVRIGNPVIPPGPIVPPNPPGPIVPPVAPTTALGKASFDGVRAVAEYPLKAAHQKALADAHFAHASAIRAGAMTDPATGRFSPSVALKEWRAAIAASLGGDIQKWKAWSDAVSPEFDRQYKSKAITNTTGDFAKAFDEIASGLR